MVTAICILAVTLFAARTYMPNIGESAATAWDVRQGESRLGDCPGDPNCVSSEASSEKHQTERLTINQDPAQSINKVVAVISATPGLNIVEQTERYLHATSTTRIMRYVDDIEFLVSDDQQTLQIRSASRLGKSDLGANAKRVAWFKSQLQDTL